MIPRVASFFCPPWFAAQVSPRTCLPKPPRQDFGKLRQALLRSVFFVPGKENNMFAGAGARFAFENDKIPSQGRKSESARDRKENGSNFHDSRLMQCREWALPRQMVSLSNIC